MAPDPVVMDYAGRGFCVGIADTGQCEVIGLRAGRRQESRPAVASAGRDPIGGPVSNPRRPCTPGQMSVTDWRLRNSSTETAASPSTTSGANAVGALCFEE